MGLDDPTIKMSKSLGERHPGHSIGLVDEPDVIRRAVARAVTDPGREMRFGHAADGVRNLLTIYEALSGEDRSAIEAHFENRGYGDLKRELTGLLIETLTPIRKRYDELMADPTELDAILRAGAARVEPVAEATLHRVKLAMGCA